MIDKIKQYFPRFTNKQLQEFEILTELITEWNSKINLISRKDIEFFELHHLLHSLSIAKLLSFKEGTTIMDLGTGGGFPGIPLAIAFPEVRFTLVDPIGKKILVVNDIVAKLKLENVIVVRGRAEALKEKFDFVVSRAVAAMPSLLDWSFPKITPRGENLLPNGLICLKGGDVSSQLKGAAKNGIVYEISEYYENEEYYKDKKIIYVQR